MHSRLRRSSHCPRYVSVVSRSSPAFFKLVSRTTSDDDFREYKDAQKPWIHFDFVPGARREILFVLSHSTKVLRAQLSEGTDSTLKDLEEEIVSEQCSHSSRICCFSVYDEGLLVLSGDEKGTVTVSSAMTKRVVISLPAHDCPVLACAVMDDRLATSGIDREIRIWDLASGQILLKIEVPTSPVISMVLFPMEDFDPQQSLEEDLVLCGGSFGSIYFWNAQRPSPQCTFSLGQVTVWGLSVSTEGVVAACGSDGLVRSYRNFSPISELRIPQPAVGCDFRQDGALLVCGQTMIKLLPPSSIKHDATTSRVQQLQSPHHELNSPGRTPPTPHLPEGTIVTDDDPAPLGPPPSAHAFRRLEIDEEPLPAGPPPRPTPPLPTPQSGPSLPSRLPIRSKSFSAVENGTRTRQAGEDGERVARREDGVTHPNRSKIAMDSRQRRSPNPVSSPARKTTSRSISSPSTKGKPVPSSSIPKVPTNRPSPVPNVPKNLGNPARAEALARSPQPPQPKEAPFQQAELNSTLILQYKAALVAEQPLDMKAVKDEAEEMFRSAAANKKLPDDPSKVLNADPRETRYSKLVPIEVDEETIPQPRAIGKQLNPEWVRSIAENKPDINTLLTAEREVESVDFASHTFLDSAVGVMPLPAKWMASIAMLSHSRMVG